MIIFAILSAIENSTHSDSRDEVELMKRIKAHDELALEQLYDLYSRVLFGIVLSVVKKRRVAEVVLQEVFINIWEKAHTFDDERGNVYSWVVTLTRNKAIDHVRVDEPELNPKGDGYDPLETTIFSDRAELVKRALDIIPEHQSEVLKVAYYRGMTQQEIADHLNVSLDTIKTRMQQGMIKLKNVLGEFISQND